ncbi:MAG: hypothetical protein ABR608_01375 [Pseudonocardiaceae bacterium]
MISRKLAGASAVSLGAATAVAALLLGTVSGSAADAPPASAYGIAAQGLLPIAPTPKVVAPPDGSDALLELPSPLGVGVLKVKAAGLTSAATAVDLDILDTIKARIIEATCDSGVGNVSILNGEIAGTALPSDPGIGEGLDLSPLATVEVNRQTENEDGTLTVDALVVKVLPGGQLGDLAITPDTLDQLRNIAPNLKVPSMEQLQTAQPQAEQPSATPPAAPTLDDLLAQLRELNPGLELPTGEGDALLEIVISSATCGPGKEGPTEAPTPKPVETKLPVTH